ncbi:MAG: hypothetical protein ACE368_11985 [Paracoccaceae bacterium]
MRQIMLGALAGLMLAGPAAAQDARLELAPSPLTETERQIVAGMFQQVQAMSETRDKVGAYGAIVVSRTFFELAMADPTSAAMAGLFQIVGNHDTIQKAERAAMDACNAARQTGQMRCVLAARILPE